MNERIAQLEATLREDTQEALKLHTRIVDLEQSMAKELERSKRIELNLAAKIDELEKDKARLDHLAELCFEKMSNLSLFEAIVSRNAPLDAKMTDWVRKALDESDQ